jgi:hypothetical protein
MYIIWLLEARSDIDCCKSGAVELHAALVSEELQSMTRELFPVINLDSGAILGLEVYASPASDDGLLQILATITQSTSR